MRIIHFFRYMNGWCFMSDTKMTLNDTKKYNCCHCNKTFNFRQNKYQHEKKCKLKDHSEKSIQETII